MMHRIVVNVIECRPEMPFRFHSSLDAIEPNLSTTRIILTIPLESRTPVEQANVMKQARQFSGENQSVVMIGQNAPRIYFFALCLQGL